MIAHLFARGSNMFRRINLSLGELILCVIVLTLGVAIFWASFDLPPPALEPIGPAAFPRWTAIILIALSGLVAWRGARTRRSGEPSETETARIDFLLWLGLLTLAYYLVMQFEFMGFRWATVGYAFLLTMALTDWRLGALPAALFWALSLGIGVHWVFTRLLFVDLP